MMLFRLYAGLWLIIMPFMRLWLSWRISRGKDRPERLPERYGVSNISRPDGTLIWVHAASVGESVSALSLTKLLFEKQPDIVILITSGTVTSAAMIANAQTSLPFGDNIIHQMQPLDSPHVIGRFLNHWRPDILISLESDIWPMMICKTHQRGIPVMLASAQMSEGSLRRWQRISPGARKIIFSAITRIEAGDDEQASRFRQITEADWTDIGVSGSLKATAPALNIDKNMHDQLDQIALDRTVVLLASSHPGEEEIVIDAVEAMQQSEAILLILTPRHVDRGKSIHAMLTQRGIASFLLSQYADHMAPSHISNNGLGKPPMQVCIADVMGHMGSLFSVADIIVMGGGFMPLGGHNPMEPAAMGKGVISGRKINKNASIYKRLDEFGGVIWADNATELTNAIIMLMTAPTRLKHLNSGATSAYQSFTKQGDAVAELVLDFIAMPKEKA